MDPQKYCSYGIHYTDPRLVPPELHHVDFGISFDDLVPMNCYGVINKVIPALRCARARDIGSRTHNQAVIYLLKKWLPQSNEEMGDFPLIFNYVNVGQAVDEDEMITDVYLPLK